MAKYLHVAILIPVGEDVPLNVSERSNPGQNSRVQHHICRLQLLRGINVCGLECKSERITAQEHDVCPVIHLIDSDLDWVSRGFWCCFHLSLFTNTGENNHLRVAPKKNWVSLNKQIVFVKSSF